MASRRRAGDAATVLLSRRRARSQWDKVGSELAARCASRLLTVDQRLGQGHRAAHEPREAKKEMPRGLPQSVRDHLDKCRTSAICAVEAYNRPGRRFRTAQYLIMMVIAWTAYFHAVFHRRGRRPWYRRRNTQAVRYVKVDGEPKHWDLSECLNQYFGARTPAERKNLEFLLGLRNKIEHRHLPDLDVPLYGECQACLLNLEEFIQKEFGPKYTLQEQLAVSLQFSSSTPSQKRAAARRLASSYARSVVEYIEDFRGRLPSTVLNSMSYSFSVFLVPKVANRAAAADAAVEFIRVDEASEEELERLEKLNVLIREKQIPIANLDLLKPSQVLDKLEKKLGFRPTMNAHTDAWKYFEVRPPYGTQHPERTTSDFCVLDRAHGDYLYTQAWVNRLESAFSSAERYREITGRDRDPVAESQRE